MAQRTGDTLKTGDRVRAVTDLGEIPEGTLGRVILVNGLEWIRYRVYFETGTDRGSLNRSDLVLVNRKGEPIPVG